MLRARAMLAYSRFEGESHCVKGLPGAPIEACVTEGCEAHPACFARIQSRLPVAWSRASPRVCKDCIECEAASEALPIAGEDLVQGAAAAMEVLVEGCEIGSEMRTGACRPHEESE